MPCKCTRASTSNNIEKRACSTESAASKSSSTADIVSTEQTTFNVMQAFIEQLNVFTVAFLCSRCQAYSLPSSGNKSALIKHLYEHFHPSDTAQPQAPIDRDTSNAHTEPSTGDNSTSQNEQ